MYVRFQAPDGEGLFAIAYDLSRSPVLTRHEQRQIAGLIEWFEEHLPIVPRAIFDHAGEGRLRCWFRPAARTHIDAAWELAGLIETHGRSVDLVRADEPGHRVFQDRFQTAVLLSLDEPAETTGQRWDRNRQTIRRWCVW